MTFPNHIAGGIVFTGTFCSLFNINIFDNPYSIMITLVASILPDIDHTKSIIGKIFFPISKQLSIKFGHRTITHSIIFFLFSSIIFLFSEKVFFNSYNYTIIFSFALLSHLLLDMLTVQGIPLFYPFAKNPCVIPANPDLRIKSGNLKSEGIALFLFTCLALFLQPLFANGFWTSYNNQFNTINHVYREYSNTKDCLVINYDYTNYNENFKGKGILLRASKTELKIINDNKLIVINQSPNTIIKALNISHSDKQIQLKKIVFQNIEIDSLHQLTKNKYVIDGNIFSNNPVMFQGTKTQKISYSESFNPDIPFIINSEEKGFKQIQMKYAKEHSKASATSSKKRNLQKTLVKLQEQLKSEKISNYEKEKIGKNIIETKNKIENIEIDYTEFQSAKRELENFPRISDTKFNGVLSFLII